MFKRNLTDKLKKALSRSPVILVTGPRQSGKTTLVKEVCTGYNYVSLDDLRYLQLAKNDPIGFISSLKKPVILDEIQRIPEIFLTIKQDVDENRVNGRYVLTGSANPLLIPKLGDSLAGRMEILKLYPLSQGEILGIKERFIDLVFEKKLPIISKIDMDKIYEAIAVGGYPSVQSIDQGNREAWFDSYITTILERDVKDISQITGIADLHLLLSLLATRVSNLFNASELSRSSGIPGTTLNRYLVLLETIFFIYFQQPWSRTLGKRLVKSPKLFLIDSGLLCFLMGTNLQKPTPLIGQILENFIANEIKKQSTWNSTRIKTFHYRSVAGIEVDIILEDYAGNIVAIEVKNSSTVSPKDFKGLVELNELMGPKFIQGIILYTGSIEVPFGKNIRALPLNCLWANEFESTT